MADKQNIILILADDLGYECLGSYGGKSYQTPRLDEIAERGVRFTYTYSLPLCTPTRMALMTGQYNFRNWRAFGVMDPDEKTFGHYMQDAGYKIQHSTCRHTGLEYSRPACRNRRIRRYKDARIRSLQE